ncbi:MAG: VacB/RNase II family 3'-5' exoribonuclease [Terracidiphilus sp.]|nr:VacB/RNase II family 3'-5' exoribonuclease [Terracidiphilus sp.]MDR3797146.1 VacB/RNase II family 3'-5' exoribonuclease [Terracidiphilus sp.]
MTDRELVARIAASAGRKAAYKQLVRELGLGGGRERRLLLEQLARLTLRGQIVQLDREHWSIPGAPSRSGSASSNNLITGRLDLHRDGYGFVRPNRKSGAPGSTGTEDIFIPPNEIGSAMQGDQVLVDVDPPKADGRMQGRIVRVLERRNATVVGTFHYADPARGHRQNVVIPFDERMTQPIVIPPGAEIPPAAASVPLHRVLGREALAPRKHESPESLVVDVEITSWPTPTRPPIGRVVEILGAHDDFGVDVEMMIRKHQLPRIFPEHVLAEARAVAHLDPSIIAQRADFRGLPIVTIDGETARDFDDAVLVTDRADGGYELQVHIADVAEYVQPNSGLDLEARLRGNSVYFPDRAIPMLPQELSTDICSLRPHEDRLVLSCIMQLDAAGRIESYEIVEGVIRSAARMTYTEVHAIIEGDAESRTRYAPLVENFERMKKLAVLMNQRREERGSIDFDLPEPVIEFDEHGQMRGVTRSERTWANRLIEEFMLAANECVAIWIEDLGVPSLYRIHEKPEPRRVVQFEELAASFGYSLGLGPLPVKRVVTRGERRDSHGRGRNPREHEVPEDIAVTPRMYQKLAARIEGKPEERILSYLMLRSLSQARYSEVNEGHFALAAPTYTHFTSPIRRYPDLIVHRITKVLLRAGVSGRRSVTQARLASPWSHPNEGQARSVASHPQNKSAVPRTWGPRKESTPLATAPIPEPELAQIADESSQAERRAAEAERELVEWKKVRFMQDRVGDEFAALVLNPAKYGLFVELTDLFVEGLVPIDSLRGDRFTWRENTHEIVGERTGRRFRAGDRVQVILDRILVQERKLQFALVEEELPLTGRKPSLSSSKSKKSKRKNTSPPPPGGSKRRTRKGRNR